MAETKAAVAMSGPHAHWPELLLLLLLLSRTVHAPAAQQVGRGAGLMLHPGLCNCNWDWWSVFCGHALLALVYLVLLCWCHACCEFNSPGVVACAQPMSHKWCAGESPGVTGSHRVLQQEGPSSSLLARIGSSFIHVLRQHAWMNLANVCGMVVRVLRAEVGVASGGGQL